VLALAALLRDQKRNHEEVRRLEGRNIALIFEKSLYAHEVRLRGGRSRSGCPGHLPGAERVHLGHKESVKDTARVLVGCSTASQYRGSAQGDVEQLAAYANVPVWNGLTDQWHPTQLLADVLTIMDHVAKAARRRRALLCRGREKQHRQLDAGGRCAAGTGRSHRGAGVTPAKCRSPPVSPVTYR